MASGWFVFLCILGFSDGAHRFGPLGLLILISI